MVVITELGEIGVGTSDEVNWPTLSNADKDLFYMQSFVVSSVVKVHVHDVAYDLIGVASSDSECDNNSDEHLEKYLISDSQGMARMKQKARKQENPSTSSTGGYPLALNSPCRSPRFLDSDSSLDAAANLYDVNTTTPNMNRHSPRKKPSQMGFTSGEDSGASTHSKRGQTESESENEGEPSSKHGKQQGGKPGGKLAASARSEPSKPPAKMKKPKTPMKVLVQDWNRKARIGLKSETARGWLVKTKKTRDNQKKKLRQARPGTTSLREIQHYQCCQQFLILVLPFNRLVREICGDLQSKSLRWQSNALFTLQCTTEAYMAGFFNDVNLCALHRKVITINRKDIWLAIQVRGREHVGGKAQVSDVGEANVSKFRIMDPTENKVKRVVPVYAALPDWPADLRAKVAPKVPLPNKGGARPGATRGKKPDPKRLQRLVWKDTIHGISKAALCRMVRRGGVQRISGMIYKECTGVLKVFLETVIKDAMIFTEYSNWLTVMPVDIIFALKHHGRNIYGFQRPFSYSKKDPVKFDDAE